MKYTSFTNTFDDYKNINRLIRCCCSYLLVGFLFLLNTHNVDAQCNLSTLSVSINSVNNADCAGNESGSAFAAASGGAGGYTYLWSNGQTDAFTFGLHAGGYIVTVTDQFGCTAVAATNITDPNGLTMLPFLVSNVSCAGGNDGSSSIIINGGTPPYNFSFPLVATGTNNATANGLTAGTHILSAVDANFCPISIAVQVQEPTLLIADIISTTDAQCFGSFDGTATVNATGGTTPYTYAWSSGATSATAIGMPADTYNVTVTDAEGCTTVTTATIGQPANLQASVSMTTNVSCNGGSDGSIEISVSGGTLPYSYQWSGNIPSDDVQDALNIPAGAYNIFITDANGCTTFINGINISEPGPINLSINNVTNADCAGNESGSAIVSAFGGTGGYTFAWSNGQTGTLAFNLHAGGYVVTATDDNGCTAVAATTITDPNGLTMTPFLVSNVSCAGGSDGSASVIINGGTAPYTFSAPLVGNGPNNAIANGLPAGSHVFNALDANNCPITIAVQIDEPTPLFAEIIHTESVTCAGGTDGSATVNGTGGTPPYSYLWSASAGGQTANIAVNLPVGLHSVTITDAEGCTDEVSVTIIQEDEIAPEFVTTIPGDETVECDAIPDPFVVIPAWHTTDNCTAAGNILIAYSETNIDIVCPNTFTIKRTWTITDEAGNTAFHIQKVNVQDTKKPTFTVPADITIECDESTLPANTGNVTDQMDNCSAPANIVVAFTDVIDLSGCGGYTGTITRTWTATDECNNVETKVQIITIEDTTMPVAVCQNVTVELDANGNASITVADIENGSTDNCAAVSQLTFALDKTTFTCADLGTNTVTLAVTDPCGNIGTCNAIVTVQDNILPVITCPSDMVIQLNPGECEEVLSFTVDGTDNCDVIVTQTGGLFSSGDAFPIGGPYILTYLATDAAGNTAECSFNVTINEFVPTNFDLGCNALVHVSLDLDCQALVTPDMVFEGNNFGCYDDYIVTITDANGNIVAGNILNLSHVGTTVDVSIEDPSTGNSCWGQILVEDKLIPTFDCPADIDVACTSATDPAITGSPILTSCETSIVITHEDDYADFGCDGSPMDASVRARIIRTWTVTDDSGNAATCVQLIRILKPELANVVFPTDKDELNDNALDCGAVAFNSNLTTPQFTGYPQFANQDVTPGGLCSFSIGFEDLELEICAGGSSYEIIRTWTVRNMCEPLAPGVNPIQHIQSIKVLDTTGPSLTCPAPITISPSGNTCDVSVNIPVAIISDDCSGFDIHIETPNGNIYTNGGLIPGSYGLGNHTVTFVATDACGNISSCDYTFTVEDTAPPIAVCDQHTVASIGSDGIAVIDALTFDDGSYDNCSDLTIDVRKLNDSCGNGSNLSFGNSVSFCCNEIGSTIMVEMRVTDALGLTNSCMVEVEVQDKIDPVIACPANQTIECIEDINDFALLGTASATDNCGVPTISHNDISNTINDCGVGTVTRVWTATDAGGRTSSCIQFISIVNSDPFTITDTECRTAPFGANHSNADDVEWPCDITLSSCGLGLSPDDLEANGNVNALDARPQLLSSPCENVAITYNDETLGFGAGNACLKVLRKWIIIDWCQAANNPDPTQPGPGVWHYTQIIKVENSTAPVISQIDGPSIVDNFDSNCGNAFASFNLFASDDCTAATDLDISWAFNTGLTGTGAFASSIFANGTYSITFTVSDQCGNEISQKHNFSVQDAKQPTPVCIFGIATTVMPSAGAVTIWATDFESGSSFDNCTAYDDLHFSFSPNINNNNITIACADIPADGLYPITLYVTDAAGNSDFCSTFINVQDPNGVCGGPAAFITGTIENENQELIQDVTVTLSDDNGLNIPVITDNNGVFTFSGMSFGDYDITPEKDINYLNGVTTFDLVLISKHILGITVFDSPYKVIAADANKSQTITTLDIVKLRSLILHIDDELSNNNSWRFVDQNHVFNNTLNPWSTPFPEYVDLDGASNIPVNFTAIKVGDVNGSAIPNNLLGSDTRNFDGKLALQVATTKVAAGEKFTVDFRAKDFDKISGYQFTLGFDAESVEFVDVTTHLQNLIIDNFGLSKLDEGVITTSWNKSEGVNVDDNEILFSLTFIANNALTTDEVLTINSRYTVAEAYNTSGLLDVVLEFNGNEVASKFELYQNTPNPFKAETQIGFNLPNAETVTLKIYDVSGRVLRLMEIEGVKGFNAVQFNRNEFDATGILYYQLETSNETATKKMILIN